MYITVPSVSYRYIVHHNIITLQLYYLLLVIRNRIDRFAIVRRKKKRKDDTQHSNSCSLFSHIMITTESLRVIFCLPFNYICTEEVCILDNINAFYIYNNLCAITMGTNLFPPPLLFFRYFSFTAPLTSLFSFFFFRCAFQLRYSLSFFPSLNQCCFFKLTKLRDIDSLYSDSERVSIVSFLLYISIPFPLSFYCLSKTFVCAFASRTKKDRFGKSRERNAAWNRFEENEQLEEAISFFVSSSFSLSSSFSPSCSTRNKRIFST